jgi:hypothetical protein
VYSGAGVGGRPAALQPVVRSSDPFAAARGVVALALLCLSGGVGAAGAASSLRLPEPAVFGEVPAATHDPDGVPLGPARLVVARDPYGRVVLESESSIAGRETVLLYGLLAPAEDGAALRPIEQRSRMLDADGALLVEIEIDHESNRARCRSQGHLETIALPEGDRVANVAMNLLLLPLARRDVEELRFQALVCRGEPQLVDVSARRTGRIVRPAAGTEAIEIEYRVELNPILARIAQPFLPRILFWIDPGAAPDPWVAHQMPLFPKGPTVFVVRRELAPEAFLSR